MLILGPGHNIEIQPLNSCTDRLIAIDRPKLTSLFLQTISNQISQRVPSQHDVERFFVYVGVWSKGWNHESANMCNVSISRQK
jgi:hypothetical protein